MCRTGWRGGRSCTSGRGDEICAEGSAHTGVEEQLPPVVGGSAVPDHDDGHVCVEGGGAPWDDEQRALEGSLRRARVGGNGRVLAIPRGHESGRCGGGLSVSGGLGAHVTGCAVDGGVLPGSCTHTLRRADGLRRTHHPIGRPGCMGCGDDPMGCGRPCGFLAPCGDPTGCLDPTNTLDHVAQLPLRAWGLFPVRCVDRDRASEARSLSNQAWCGFDQCRHAFDQVRCLIPTKFRPPGVPGKRGGALAGSQVLANS